jgi:aldehyde:ferredoxin oxidoreductase
MHGMDTISCGGTIAWAMDCFERGLLTRAETDGIDLRFGNAEAMVLMVEKIARREGLGRVLGEGSARAAERLNVGRDLVVAVKNQELPAHMPQHKPSLALVYSINPFGADHQSHEHDPFYTQAFADRAAQLGLVNPQPVQSMNTEKLRYVLYTQYFYSATDAVCVCQFVFGPSFQLYSPAQLVEAIRAVTGWDYTLWELMKTGERRLNLLRAYNAREGVGVEGDTKPAKLAVPLRGGPTDGVRIPTRAWKQQRADYYRMAGWDRKGRPTRGKLEELGLDLALDDTT